MVIKVETTEGFHTKTMNCDHIQALTEVSETFVTRMASLISEVGIITDYNLLATEIAQPLSEEFIEDEELKQDYLMHMDLTEAISTGVGKVGYDEEMIWQLKQRITPEDRFNMIKLNFRYGQDQILEDCDGFKYWLYNLLGYPYYIFQKITGQSIVKLWKPYRCNDF